MMLARCLGGSRFILVDTAFLVLMWCFSLRIMSVFTLDLNGDVLSFAVALKSSEDFHVRIKIKSVEKKQQKTTLYLERFDIMNVTCTAHPNKESLMLTRLISSYYPFAQSIPPPPLPPRLHNFSINV